MTSSIKTCDIVPVEWDFLAQRILLELIEINRMSNVLGQGLLGGLKLLLWEMSLKYRYKGSELYLWTWCDIQRVGAVLWTKDCAIFWHEWQPNQWFIARVTAKTLKAQKSSTHNNHDTVRNTLQL